MMVFEWKHFSSHACAYHVRIMPAISIAAKFI